MQKRMTTRGRPRSGIGTPNHAVAVIVTVATIAITSQQAPAFEITPCDINPCNPWCPDPDCNPTCGGSPNDDDCLMKDCSANGGDSSVDCQKSCCPCSPNCGDPDRGADVSVWPDLTWVGGIVRVTVCSAWPAETIPCCFGLGPRDSYITTQTEITCPQVLPAVDWDDIYNDYPLWPPAYDDVPYCTPFAPSHDLSCWLECPDDGCNLTAHGGWVFLPASYTFYLATPLMDGGHVTPWDDGAGVSIGNFGSTIGGLRKFGLMHLDVDIGYTAGWPDDPLEDLEPGTWIGANDGFGEGKPTEDWEDDSPCHGSGNYPVINTGVTHLPIDLALIEGINRNDLCGDLYERLSLTLQTTDEDLARIFCYYNNPEGCADSWERVMATDPIDEFHFKQYPLDERGKWVGWQFYLEGLRPGTVLVELTGIIDGDCYRERIDRILVHIAKIDVDVDSDNTNTDAPYGPDAADPMTEDRIEEKAGEPGRFVLLNNDDDDQDGILDLDDGYNKNGTPDPDDRTYKDGTHKEDDFVMLKVKIAPTSIDLDPNKAWVQVAYSAASPDPAVPMSGRIRLWKRLGDEPRDRRSALSTGQGDWIAPGEYTDLKRLMPWDPNLQPDPGNPTATHEMTFYIEGVQTSQALGDVKITFKLDPDGEGPAPYVHMDTVQVTVVDINIETNSDNSTDGDIDAYDNMIEDEFPGRAMWPNADNDNYATDNRADLEKNGQVLGENDLAEIHVDVLPEIPGLMVKLDASPANLVKVWLQADKSTPAPMEWNAQNLPYTLWVEGLADPGTATLTLSLVSSPGAKDSIKMTVFMVADVYWVEHEGNSSLTGCPKNGGKRIFADDETPNESDTISNNRKKVDIIGYITPAPQMAWPYVWVYLKKWDVDDPSADGDIVDNLPLDDQQQFVANAGPDNRADQPGVVWSTPVVRPDGRFSTWMYVSPQPGNNYSVTATTTPDAHENYLKQEWVDQAVREHRGCIPSDSDCYAIATDMLTVWRRLHVELDSMAAVSANTVTGVVASASAVSGSTSPNFQRAKVEFTYKVPIDFRETNHFTDAGCAIDISGVGVFDTKAESGSNYVIISVPIAQAPALIAAMPGKAFVLWDDDYTYTNPPLVLTPRVSMPRLADTSLLGSVFHRCYIEPVLHGEGSPESQTNSPFQVNIDSAEYTDYVDVNKNLTSSGPFWAVHVTSAYQGYPNKDLDEGGEAGTIGGQYGITCTNGDYPGGVAHGSLVYLESIRDSIFASSGLEPYTVAHEIGHQFWLDDATDDYLMSNGTPSNPTPIAKNLFFSPNDTAWIRSITHPQH